MTTLEEVILQRIADRIDRDLVAEFERPAIVELAKQMMDDKKSVDSEIVKRYLEKKQ